ncbi:MAG: hypothetical protein IJW40_07365 [Clostridia bacterium]|nr:hypothetical protein [Clostridia bacterium]
MKKFLVLLLALAMLITCFALTACGDDEQPGEEQNQDGDGTPDPSGDEPHTHAGGEATCQAKAVCADCGEEYGELAAHDYDKDGVCSVCGAVDPEVEAAKKAAEEAAAPVIEQIKALEAITAVDADNYADVQAKYDAANGAYGDLNKDAKAVVGADNKEILTAVKNLIKKYETALAAAKALEEYKTTLAGLPTISVAKATITLDGEFDTDALDKCSPMTLTKEQCDEWNAAGRGSVDGASVVGDTALTAGAETDVSFYFMYDENNLYIVEWRCDLNWNFSAVDYVKSYTGDGSLLWFVNTGKAADWLASGSMSSAPACGLMWNAGVGGEKPGENNPQIAYFPDNTQTSPVEKTASGEWEYALKWDENQYYYVLEVAIPWADLPFTMADLEAGNISATFCSVDIVNPEFDGDSGKLWKDMGYQMQYPGVNHWHLSEPLLAVK